MNAMGDISKAIMEKIVVVKSRTARIRRSAVHVMEMLCVREVRLFLC